MVKLNDVLLHSIAFFASVGIIRDHLHQNPINADREIQRVVDELEPREVSLEM
ncbi:hypothetical protein D3C85_1450670 [compost metagenome]